MDTMAKRGRKSTLTLETVAALERAIAAGLPESVAATVAGVPYSNLRYWLNEARAGRGGPLCAELLTATTRARGKAEAVAIGQIRKAGANDWRAASWWLSHSPSTRDRWSEAGYERSIERRLLAEVVKVLEAEIPDLEERRRLFLALTAAGLGEIQSEAADDV